MKRSSLWARAIVVLGLILVALAGSQLVADFVRAPNDPLKTSNLG
jgi:hypothetical protein